MVCSVTIWLSNVSQKIWKLQKISSRYKQIVKHVENGIAYVMPDPIAEVGDERKVCVMIISEFFMH